MKNEKVPPTKKGDSARVCLLNGQYINIFGSRDTIVLKALSLNQPLVLESRTEVFGHFQQRIGNGLKRKLRF